MAPKAKEFFLGGNVPSRLMVHDVDKVGTGGYNYYGYLEENGMWMIQREKTDGTEYRYRSGITTPYSTAWTNRTASGISYYYINAVVMEE